MTGEKVKNVIIAKGYSVAQVAEMIGTSQQNLASGLKHTDVRSGLLEKIAEALSMPVLEFYGEKTPSGYTAGDATVSEALELLKIKEEQLCVAMRQTSKAQEQTTKAQEQMDRVLDAFIPRDPAPAPVISRTVSQGPTALERVMRRRAHMQKIQSRVRALSGRTDDEIV